LVTKVEAIGNFLTANTHADLAELYSPQMECQVNVAQDGGERIEDTYQGRRWHGWQDESGNIWKSFRIPYKANTEPEFNIASRMNFDLQIHAEGIGMTGWDWSNRVSKFVAFDFDSLINHKSGFSVEELDEVKKAALDIPWVSVRKSTSGTGFHIYILLDDVPTENHTVHAGLARAILGKMSAIAGFDFNSKVDVCGGNMWVWHRKMRESHDGLKLIKQGDILEDIPPNWRDHAKMLTKKGRRANLNHDVNTPAALASIRAQIKLDGSHQELITHLESIGAMWWWDQDLHMLVTHTSVLKEVHEELNFEGFFDTNSTGKNLDEQNCFCFPLKNGAWSVRRYSQGCSEHESWDTDASGWTRTYLNSVPDFASACRAYGGVEDPKGGFRFREVEVAQKAAKLLKADIQCAVGLLSRSCVLKQHKDGRLITEIKRDPNDPPNEMPGWFTEGNKPWTRIFNIRIDTNKETETAVADDIVRHLITQSNEETGWFLSIEDRWVQETLTNIRVALKSMGMNEKQVSNTLGTSVFQAFTLVNKPFQPEYPGDRQWNRNAASFRYVPTEESDNLHYPTWLKILKHAGDGLTDTVRDEPWCKANGIITGSDYLKCWIASMFQFPDRPLPYLFFYSKSQNTGKSTFHEALRTLLTSGYQKAEAAVTNPTGYNGELEGAILCSIEEINLKRDKTAYNRIKDWVTSPDILIHPKGKTPYQTPNTTHWIQCSNDHNACPVFPGDTRITMCNVQALDPLDLIPKRKLFQMLDAEAPDFLAAILALEIPESNDRLNVPVINTGDKMMLEGSNENMLDAFIRDQYDYIPGNMIKLSNFYEHFIRWLPENEKNIWSKIKMGRELDPSKHPKARTQQDPSFFVGNIARKGAASEPGRHLVVKTKGSYEVLVPKGATND